MSKKEIRPFWTTTVDPSEYNYRKQFSEAVKIANKQKEVFSPLDIGKVWGLVESHARLERENTALREALKEIVELNQLPAETMRSIAASALKYWRNET